ncbi:hypothetical protein [Nocardioides sp.]|uniref:hypothetical protein n=1 Tax=Nocardioides sp. TaxID=35761 RepID=UPI0026289AA0|nr:hypothetical protein [Nocardioides sp.]MDI6911855.1 hypothetical protein [Nocardioides sp.]
MRTPRLTLAVTALLTALAVSGCSGSDGEQPDAESPSSTSASESSEAQKPFERACSVEAEVTGTVEASWAGKGRASNEAGPTMYQFSKGQDQMTVYAGKDDIPTNANITIDGATFTTTDPDIGLDVAGNGTKAVVDADTTGVDGPGPHVSATFTCGKGKSKGNG